MDVQRNNVIQLLAEKFPDGIDVDSIKAEYKKSFGTPLNLRHSNGRYNYSAYLWLTNANRENCWEIKHDRQRGFVVSLAKSEFDKRKLPPKIDSGTWRSRENSANHSSAASCSSAAVKPNDYEISKNKFAKDLYDELRKCCRIPFDDVRSRSNLTKEQLELLLFVTNRHRFELVKEGAVWFVQIMVPVSDPVSSARWLMENVCPLSVLLPTQRCPGLPLAELLAEPQNHKPPGCKVRLAQYYGPEKFYIQFEETQGELEKLMEQMQEFYAENVGARLTIGDDLAKVDIVCAATYKETNQWHRAIVKQRRGQTFDVLYVDFGTVDAVSLFDLRKLLCVFTALPAQGVPAKLPFYPNPAADPAVVQDNFLEFCGLTEGNGELYAHIIGTQDETLVMDLVHKDKQRHTASICETLKHKQLGVIQDEAEGLLSGWSAVCEAVAENEVPVGDLISF